VISMGTDLKDKVALVTGASRGIGAAIAKGLSAEGVRVVVTYQQERDAADKVARECDGETMLMQLDVTDRVSFESLFYKVVEAWGRLDILINNAGYLKQIPLAGIDDDEWQRTVDTNLKGGCTGSDC